MRYNRFSKLQVRCVGCGAITTRKYACEHDGKCKTCVRIMLNRQKRIEIWPPFSVSYARR
jgi:hypothetical protein